MLSIHRNTDAEIAARVLQLAATPEYPLRPRVGVLLAVDDYGSIHLARSTFTMRTSWEQRHAAYIIGFYTTDTPANYITDDLAHLRQQRAQAEAVIQPLPRPTRKVGT